MKLSFQSNFSVEKDLGKVTCHVVGKLRDGRTIQMLQATAVATCQEEVFDEVLGKRLAESKALLKVIRKFKRINEAKIKKLEESLIYLDERNLFIRFRENTELNHIENLTKGL